MIKEKLELFKRNFKKLRGKGSDGAEDNNAQKILRKQIIRAAAVVICLLMILWLLSSAVSDAGKSLEDEEQEEKEGAGSSRNIDLADKALDTELFWRNYFEEDLKKQQSKTKELIDLLTENQEKALKEVKSSLTEAVNEVHRLKEQQQQQFDRAARQLQDSLEEQRILAEAGANRVSPVNIDEIGFEDDVVFDEPKSVEDYIPEGTYFSGYLLHGVVLATGLNAPDEKTSSVTIRLQGRGNLDTANKLKISDCHIEGSAYGELSSERGVFRLEKMICKANGMYITSDIAGEVIGDDGLDGIKGTVVSTSTKHLKNAAIGGMISGLVSASKGQEGLNISANGIAGSKSKSMGDLLQSGGVSGISNVGEKIADHYLRLADSLSPVLVIPAGVKINPKIKKGFFVGERDMKAKIKRERKVSKGQK